MLSATLDKLLNRGLPRSPRARQLCAQLEGRSIALEVRAIPRLRVASTGRTLTVTRDDARKAVARLRPGGKLDEDGAKLISVREGINVILAGGIERKGDGYVLTVRAVDAHLRRSSHNA